MSAIINSTGISKRPSSNITTSDGQVIEDWESGMVALEILGEDVDLMSIPAKKPRHRPGETTRVPVVTTTAGAKTLNVRRSSFRNFIKRRQLRAIRANREWYVPLHTFQTFAKERIRAESEGSRQGRPARGYYPD